MILLGDVPILIASDQIAPARAAYRDTRGAGLGTDKGAGQQDGLQISPTQYRRDTDALQTAPKSYRRPR